MNSEIQDNGDFEKRKNGGGEQAEAATAGIGSQIRRPTAVGERSKSMIGQGVDLVRINAAVANSSAANDQLAGVPVTTIQMCPAKDQRDSSLSNTKAGKKFQPASQRSKSFIKQAGLAYGTNSVSSAYGTAVNDRGAEAKNKSPFSSKLFKMEAQSSSSNQNYTTKLFHRSVTQGAGGHNYAFQQQYQTEQAQNTIQLSNNIINDSSFNNETFAEDQSELSPSRELLSQTVDIEQNIFDSSNSQDNVKVVVRVRPLNEREQKTGTGKAKCVQVEDGTILLDRGFDLKKFHFDFVGQEDIGQQTMFNRIAKPIADSCMQGYNGTIFAYGQTGAGKTFTIQGPTIDVEGSGDQMAIQNGMADAKGNRGIMQRSFEYIFQNIEAQKKLIEEKADGSELSFLIKCSYLEIYNEQIMDLLEPSSINLHVREDIKKGVYVEGLQEEVVGSYRDMIQLIQKGGKNRHVGSTSLNRESSRSHSVLTTIIESKSMSHTGVWNMKTSRFHIIDLAGSERSKNTDAVGERLKEAGMINKSLSALGNVINSLVDLSEGKSRHVPYRDSKLTFILRDSLGGNSRTVIIANISPSNVNMGETLSTLEFARRAKQIKNRAVVNEDSSGTILILKNEIKRLKKDMMEQGRHFQELMNQKKLWTQTEQICKVCRTNMRLDSAEGREFDQRMQLEEDTNLNEDSLLIDSPSRSQNEMKPGDNAFGSNNGAESPRKAQQRQLTDRLKQAESLLAANLENLSSQQKFYEDQIAKYKEEIRNLSQSVDALNGQVSRDKMKMKLREDKIQKLEQEHGITPDENASMLQQEIKILQEQIQQERNDVTNPKIAKMASDYKLLLDAKAQLEKELNQDVNSLSVQFANQSNMIEELNDYLKTKANIQAFESLDANLSRTKQQQADLQEVQDKLQSSLEDLQQEYDILLTQNVKAEEQNQKLTREYGKAKVEIQSLNEQIETLQQSSKQRVGEINRFAADIKEQAEKLLNLETALNNQNQQLEAKVEENAHLKDTIENIELELNQRESEIKSLKDEIVQKLKDIEEQETINETLHVQVEQENTQKNKLANELKEAQNQVFLNEEDFDKEKESLNGQIQNLNEAMIKLTLDSECKIERAQEQNELKLANLAEEHQVEADKITTRLNVEISKLQNDKDQDKAQIALLNRQLNDQKEQASEYQAEISKLQEVVHKLKQAQQEELDELKLHIENKSCQSSAEMQMIMAQIEEKNFEIDTLTNEIADHKRHISELKQEIEFQSIESQNQKQELEHAAKEAETKQSRIDDLNSRAEDYDVKVKSLTGELKHRGEEMRMLNSTMAELKTKHQQEISQELTLQKKELKKQMQEKTEDMQSQMDTIIANLKQEKKQQLAELEMQLLDLQSKLEVERKERDVDLEMLRLQIKELKGQNANHESNISYLDVSISEMNANIQDKQGLIADLSKKNEALKEQYEIEHGNFLALQEEIEACKQLLAEKNQQTAGAEQETAEGQVLLLEAQDLISQKIEEVDQLEAALQESGKQKDEAKASNARLETQIKQKDSELASMAQQIRQLNDQVAISQDLLDKQIAQFDQLKENLDLREEELQKFENEKINLQFKRDEGTKNLEQKIKELKIQNKKLNETNESQEKELQSQTNAIESLRKDLEDSQGGKEQQHQNLVTKLQDFQSMNEELVKEIDMLRETQEEFINKIEKEKEEHQQQSASLQQLLEKAKQEKENIMNSHKDEKSQSMLSLQEHTHKQTALLKEVSDMQVYMDELTESLNQATRAAKEVDKIKQDCYRKIEIIQSKNKSSSENEEAKKDVDEEKTLIKNNISAVLAEIADVSLYAHNSNDQDSNNKVDLLVDSQKSIEVNLLISQIVCEISKLYEKQIVLEKQKASQDFKKFTDKHEKQKADIKQMQMYHANKVNDLAKDNQQMKVELEGKKKELLQHLSEQNKEDNDIADQFELANEQLKVEKEEKEQILSELERYKVYLPEAEGLLQEVNNRHQGALEEIEQQQKITTEYEREILDLNKNLKNLKKALQDQKQLYEVRVQSQEQEIDQHQFRYRELEKKLVEDIYQQEIKFAQVQEQVQILGQIKKQAKQDREAARKQMQEMQASVELVEQNDKIQRQEMQQLKQKIQQRENEMAEVVDSLKQFVEANRYLESENQRLTLELELMAGHKNPQQKIQLHLKIKEENNRLREDNLRLQDDLSKKIDIIQRHQKENRTQQLLESTQSPKDKNEVKTKKEFDNLVLHIVSQPQFAKLAKSHNMNLKIQGSQSLPKILELLSMVDDALEAKDEQIQGLRKMPPKPQGQLNLQNYISKPKRNEQANLQAQMNDNLIKMSSTQKYRSPGIQESRSNAISQGGSAINQNLNSMGMLPPNQILMRAGSASGLKSSSSQAESQHAPIREQNRLNSGSKRQIQPNLQGTQQLQNKLSAGSPVMLNSYSSLYKQGHSHRGSSRDQQLRSSAANDGEDNQPIQMRPEKENSVNQTLLPNGYSDLVNKQKQYHQNQAKTQRAGELSSKQLPPQNTQSSGAASSFNAQFQNLMSNQSQYQPNKQHR